MGFCDLSCLRFGGFWKQACCWIFGFSGLVEFGDLENYAVKDFWISCFVVFLLWVISRTLDSRFLGFGDSWIFSFWRFTELWIQGFLDFQVFRFPDFRDLLNYGFPDLSILLFLDFLIFEFYRIMDSRNCWVRDCLLLVIYRTMVSRMCECCDSLIF